jgi:hypothetical protein
MSTGGGPLGGGGYFGRAGDYGPRGPFGAWPGCGCGTLIMILAVILFVCGGCLSVVESTLRF